MWGIVGFHSPCCVPPICPLFSFAPSIRTCQFSVDIVICLDLGLIPGLGRSSGEGKGYLLQYSGLEDSMDYIVSL